MYHASNVYKYIATCVDDLAICSKDPQSIVDRLTKDYNYKLKGAGLILPSWM